MSAALKLIEPKPQADEAALRHDLATKLEERDSALARRDKARATADSADAFIGELQARVDAFDAIDAQIANERALAFKAALAKGDAMPKLTLSPELARASTARLDAENNLAGAKQAAAALNEELAVTERTLAQCEANAKAAAKAVVAQHANAMAHELSQLETHAGEMRRRLLGVTAMRAPHVGEYQVSRETMALLRDNPINSIYTRNSAEDVLYWDRYLARLMRDANAQPDEAA